MSIYQANFADLEAHATLHERMAQFYRGLAYDLEQQGGIVVQELYRTTFNDDDAIAYKRWLDFAHLYQQATAHDEQAQYFHNLVQKLRQLEQDLS